MGFIDLENDGKQYLARVKAALSRRGLKPDLSEEWTIHGPHQNMDYPVLIGWAHDGKDNWHLVAVYPRAVYEIEDESNWWDVGSKNRLWVDS
ncbi:MAG: hypothetical protein ACE14P_06310 [Methanotrichaceae archaeon]